MARDKEFITDTDETNHLLSLIRETWLKLCVVLLVTKPIRQMLQRLPELIEDKKLSDMFEMSRTTDGGSREERLRERMVFVRRAVKLAATYIQIDYRCTNKREIVYHKLCDVLLKLKPRTLLIELMFGWLCEYVERTQTHKYDSNIKEAQTLRFKFKNAKNRVIVLNQGLSYKVAGWYSFLNGIDIDELAHIGNIGLLRAIDRFDIDSGYKFSTYSINWVHSMIREMVWKRRWSCSLPEHIKNGFFKIKKMCRELSVDGHEPSVDELVEKTGLEKKKVEMILVKTRCNISLDVMVHKNDDGVECGPLVDNIEYENQQRIDDYVECKLKRERIRELLLFLPMRDYDIICQRFGINDGVPKTLDVIGQQYGMTRERVRQIEHAVFERIRTSPNYKQMRDTMLALL